MDADIQRSSRVAISAQLAVVFIITAAVLQASTVYGEPSGSGAEADTVSEPQITSASGSTPVFRSSKPFLPTAQRPPFSAYQATYYHPINLRPLHDYFTSAGKQVGFDPFYTQPGWPGQEGKFMKIAVLDTGIDPYHPAFWNSEIRIAPGSEATQEPDIAVEGTNVHVVWIENATDPKHIYYKRSTDGGFTWSNRKSIHDSPTAIGKIAIAVNGTTVHLVWDEAVDVVGAPSQGEIFYKRSTDNGDTWQSPIQLTCDSPVEVTVISRDPSQAHGHLLETSNVSLDSFDPAIAVSGNTVHVVWVQTWLMKYSDPPHTDLHNVTESTTLEMCDLCGTTDEYLEYSHGVFYLRSTDGGATWPGGATGIRANPDWYCLSYKNVTKWQQSAPYHYYTEYPDVAVYGSRVEVVWRQIDVATGDSLLYSGRSWTGGSGNTTWNRPGVYVFTPKNVTGVCVAATANHTHVAYGHLPYTPLPLSTGNIRYINYNISTNVWGNDVALTTSDKADLWFLDIAAYKNKVHVVFADNRTEAWGGDFEIYYKRNMHFGNASTWDDGDGFGGYTPNQGNNNNDVTKRCSIAARDSVSPAIAISKDEPLNVIHIVWCDSRDFSPPLCGTYEVYYSLSCKIYAWNDFINNWDLTGDGDGNDVGDAYDNNGHGTAVSSIAAGTMVARTSTNNTYNPFYGVAYNAILAVGKVLGFPATEAEVIQGIQWAVSTADADVISMSLGWDIWSDGSRALTRTVDWAVEQRNVPVVIALANAGYNATGTRFYGSTGYPEDCFQGTGVGGTTRNGTAHGKTWFASLVPPEWRGSSCGPTLDRRLKPEVVAPGWDYNEPLGIYVADPKAPNGYEKNGWHGNSFATPHVSGTIALLKQKNPAWNSAQLKQAILRTATDCIAPDDPVGPDNIYGFGRLNVWSAAQYTHVTDFVVSAFPYNIANLTEYYADGRKHLNLPLNYTINFTVNVHSFNGFSAPVQLSLLGLPQNITAIFTPAVVTPTPNNVSVAVLTLDIGMFAPGGTHHLTVRGVSGALVSNYTFSITIPHGPPIIALVSPANGSVIAPGTPIILNITDKDNDLNTVNYSVNGGPPQPFYPPHIINTTGWSDGTYTIVINANDTMGNTISAVFTFTIDGIIPQIEINFIVENSSIVADYSRILSTLYFRKNVTVIVNVIDANPYNVTITLNGAPFVNGTKITAEGNYIIFVQATDRAGNVGTKSVSFIIDKTPPEIRIQGVADNAYYNTSVTPIITVTDTNLDASNISITLNGVQFTSGTEISAEGSYEVVVQAGDYAGNNVTKKLRFVIDKTPPQIVIQNVADNGIYNHDITPLIFATDANLESMTITLNGVQFTSGTEISAEGSYTLNISASDKAGNVATMSIKFGIDKTAPAPPELEPLPQLVIKPQIFVHGSAEPNCTLKLYNNNNLIHTLMLGADGKFNVSINLTEGKNVLMATATDRANNTSPPSLQRNVTLDTKPPAAVTLAQVGAGDITSDSIKIRWSRSTDDDFAKYVILMAKEERNFNVLVEINDRNTTEYTVRNLAPGTKYYFKVRVVDRATHWTDSNIVEALTSKLGISVGGETPWFLPAVFVIVVLVTAVCICFALLKRRKKFGKQQPPKSA